MMNDTKSPDTVSRPELGTVRIVDGNRIARIIQEKIDYRNNAINHNGGSFHEDVSRMEAEQNALLFVQESLLGIPTLNATLTRYGEWRNFTNDKNDFLLRELQCSICGFHYKLPERPYSYCPRCGAHMSIPYYNDDEMERVEQPENETPADR